jgi:hypothetical protein
MMCIYICICIMYLMIYINDTYILSFSFFYVRIWGLPSARLMPMESKATGPGVDGYTGGCFYG